MIRLTLNGKPLSFIRQTELATLAGNPRIFHVAPSTSLSGLLETLEQHPYEEPERFYVLSENPALTFRNFCSMFSLVTASGGAVLNAEKDLLMIFRNGKWDLPKGKLEEGESPEQGALRETEEECGLGGLSIVRDLKPTFHSYMMKNTRVLKKTWWYEMSCEGRPALVPQQDEGITEARWMHRAEVKEALQNTFPNIRDVVEGLGYLKS